MDNNINELNAELLDDVVGGAAKAKYTWKLGKTYTVIKGDSLSKIGNKIGIPWQVIYNHNTDLIKDPNLIQVGWKLKVPDQANI